VIRPTWTPENDRQRELLATAAKRAEAAKHADAAMWAAILEARRAGVPDTVLMDRTDQSRATLNRKAGARRTLDEWWEGLSAADRTLFLAHRTDRELPAEVVQRLIATGQIIVGAKWEADPDWTFYWPTDIADLLTREAGESPE
jgi:hypothetical protein